MACIDSAKFRCSQGRYYFIKRGNLKKSGVRVGTRPQGIAHWSLSIV